MDPAGGGWAKAQELSSSAAGTPDASTPADSPDESPVSELDSDMEPDQLLETYLEIKTRLYRIQPDLVESQGKSKKGKKDGTVTPKISEVATRKAAKLQRKLQTIRSDALFDQKDADGRWNLRRNQIAQEAAERRRLQLPEPEDSSGATSEDSAARVDNLPGEKDNVRRGDDGEDGESADEETTFGDLFNAVAGPGEGDSSKMNGEGSQNGSELITIRDFGNPKGVSPRRILEEACRSRDSQVKLSYKLESNTAFSYRHSVTIVWSKDQNTSFPLQWPKVSSTSTSRSTKFTMHTIAAPDSQQSESFVSTFALFQIFSASQREEKAHLRLPSTYRELWYELQDQSNSESEKRDMELVKELRELVRTKMEGGNEETVTLTTNFKKRNGDVSGRSSPGLVQDMTLTKGQESNNQQLKDLWQSKCSTPSYSHMLSFRMHLPMYSFKTEALSAVEENQVTIICGDTGCGKSTQMPQFILENELSHGRPCKIYCTEPRRISAITLAQRVSEELGESKADLGTPRSLVGYAIRLESHISQSTRLVYATTGIVLRMLESPSEGFDEITHIILDEVHERSIETDFLLIVLRSLIKKRPLLKVILMSATVDAQKFSNYFGGAPVMNVPGRTFSVETKFLEDAIELTGHVPEQTSIPEVEDSVEEPSDGDSLSTSKASLQQYSAKTRNTLSQYDEYGIDYELILKLIESISKDPAYKRYSKAILVFLPGIGEIRRMNDMLGGTQLSRDFVVHALHSSIASDEQQQAFTIPPKGKGKIVLSTNIAETGVTIPDITAVIDTGKHKEMRFDERRQISRLVQSFISRANAKQRRGRAGRVQEGLCFHLLTNARFEKSMNDQQTPEMLRLSLQDLIMRVKICNLGDIQTTLAQALDPPSAKNIQRAIGNLIEVGALTSGEELTPLGRQLAKLPLDPYLGKLILYGAIFHCLDTALTLAAILTSKSPFVTSSTAAKATDHARMSFQKGDSDLLTEFNAYSTWRRVSQTQGVSTWNFCKKNMLSLQTLSNIEELKAQLLSSLTDTGIISLGAADRSALNRIHNSGQRNQRFVSVPAPFDANENNLDLITSVVGWSFYPKLLDRQGKGWRNINTNQSISIHPSSVIRNLNIPKASFLSYYSILQSTGSKHYNANSLTVLNPLAIILLAGEATFHPIAQVVSIDGSKLRFSIIDGWKTFLALKILRKKLEEMIDRRWKRPQKSPIEDSKVREWWEICTELVESWQSREDMMMMMP